MVGHVDDSFLVGGSFENNVKRIVTFYSICSSSLDRSRETVLSVLSSNSKDYRRVGLLFHVIDLVNPATVAPTMKAICIIIGF